MQTEQDDPIRMYIVVNKSLNMSVSKLAIQVGHAVGLLTQRFYLISSMIEKLSEDAYHNNEEYVKLLNTKKIFYDWMNADYGKISLEAGPKEWEKVKTELSTNSVLVKDNGLTELSPGSETCIGFMPMYKSQRPKILKQLQLLK